MNGYGCSFVAKLSRKTKMFFKIENICFLQDIYYLQKKHLFTRNKNFTQKKKTITEKTSIKMSHLRNIFLCRNYRLHGKISAI